VRARQTDLEVEVLAEQLYRERHEDLSLYVPWRRCRDTVRNGYRAAAKKHLASRTKPLGRS
jgi:hypothetical protein